MPHTSPIRAYLAAAHRLRRGAVVLRYVGAWALVLAAVGGWCALWADAADSAPAPAASANRGPFASHARPRAAATPHAHTRSSPVGKSLAAQLVRDPNRTVIYTGLLRELSDLFATSGFCGECHVTDGVVLRDSQGNDVSMANDWRSTMMANSFRDPYFRATLEHEVEQHPALAADIEDKCLTCHAPMARTEYHYDQVNAGADPASVRFRLADAKNQALALDGVSCAVCHQIQPYNLGTPESLDGGYEITDTREIYGPYQDVYQYPMVAGLNYFPQYGAHMLGSDMCATCHTLFTPILDDNGSIVGEFPEQMPYFEWKNSIFAQPGSQERSCQDCHMPVITDPIQISNDPPLDPHTPFWKHHFVGGNTFMLSILRDNGTALATTATTEQFNTTIDRALKQLQENTARLEILDVALADTTLTATLRITNLTGHKFPSGYPSRRAWIHFTVRNAEGAVLFESGAYDSRGVLAHNPATGDHERHHAVVSQPAQTQIYEAVMGDLKGAPTTQLLRAATYLKDNRVPPKGFVTGGPGFEWTKPRGEAATDPDFNRNAATEGTGTDTIRYRVAVPPGSVIGSAGNITITAELLYQSVPANWVEKFRGSTGVDRSAFVGMYDAGDPSPVLIERALYPALPSSLWIAE